MVQIKSWKKLRNLILIIEIVIIIIVIIIIIINNYSLKSRWIVAELFTDMQSMEVNILKVTIHRD